MKSLGMTDHPELTEPLPDGYSYVCGKCAKRYGPEKFGPRELQFLDCESCESYNVHSLTQNEKPLRWRR